MGRPYDPYNPDNWSGPAPDLNQAWRRRSPTVREVLGFVIITAVMVTVIMLLPPAERDPMHSSSP